LKMRVIAEKNLIGFFILTINLSMLGCFNPKTVAFKKKKSKLILQKAFAIRILSRINVNKRKMGIK